MLYGIRDDCKHNYYLYNLIKKWGSVPHPGSSFACPNEEPRKGHPRFVSNSSVSLMPGKFKKLIPNIGTQTVLNY